MCYPILFGVKQNLHGARGFKQSHHAYGLITKSTQHFFKCTGKHPRLSTMCTGKHPRRLQAAKPQVTYLEIGRKPQVFTEYDAEASQVLQGCQANWHLCDSAGVFQTQRLQVFQTAYGVRYAIDCVIAVKFQHPQVDQLADVRGQLLQRILRTGVEVQDLCCTLATRLSRTRSEDEIGSSPVLL
jgi:hypothetical protein